MKPVITVESHFDVGVRLEHIDNLMEVMEDYLPPVSIENGKIMIGLFYVLWEYVRQLRQEVKQMDQKQHSKRS